ncbi:MAG: phycobilisome Linker polypeptide [Coleofasciculaceae cyanobacterium RL_1_1]|nr:phycobilisome Linker polypeptide [Coleofasciculaceae cyanobacterium RL_1_1]
MPGASEAEFEGVIRALYRQVLGNAHVMDSERLSVEESQLRSGRISVREFVRRLAKSQLYRTRFFDGCYSYRGIELNFKHLLGRAPDNFDETRYHTSILDTEGYEADIDSYLDSEEYQATFGEWTVPYYRGYTTQPGQSMVAFTNMLKLLKSASTSDYDAIAHQPPIAMASIMSRFSQGRRTPPSDPAAVIAAALQSVVRSSGEEIGTATPATVDSLLQDKSDQQGREIAQLQQDLAQVQRMARMGESFTGHLKYNSVASPAEVTSGDGAVLSLDNRVESQAKQIEALRQQINQARSLALVGEACLNRWRTRIFS